MFNVADIARCTRNIHQITILYANAYQLQKGGELFEDNYWHHMTALAFYNSNL